MAENTLTRDEILALLNEHQGTVHVWRTLRTRYGDPKNTYGSFVHMVIRENKASNAGTAAIVSAPVIASSNAHSNANTSVPTANSGSNTVGTVEHSPTHIQTSVQADANAHSDFIEYLEFCAEYGLNPWPNQRQTIIYVPTTQQPAVSSLDSFIVEMFRNYVRLLFWANAVRSLNQ